MERLELALRSGHVGEDSVEFADSFLVESVDRSIQFLLVCALIVLGHLVALLGEMPILGLHRVDLFLELLAFVQGLLVKLFVV